MSQRAYQMDDGDFGSEAMAHAEISREPTSLEQMRRLWRIITNAQHKRDAEMEQHLRALERDNAALRETIEQLARREARARYLANHDGLTGLPNRSLLMDRFVQAAAHARRCGHPMALMIFDLDGFKAINDCYGHVAGDQLLKRVGERIREAARAGDTVCRYGGDEFVMLLPGVECMTDAETAARRVDEGIADCLRMDDIHVEVSASCGIALYPDDGENWNTLLEAADAAMYRCKPGRQRDDGNGADGTRWHLRHDRVPLLHFPDTSGQARISEQRD